jgi:hypothetical protein
MVCGGGCQLGGQVAVVVELCGGGVEIGGFAQEQADVAGGFDERAAGAGVGGERDALLSGAEPEGGRRHGVRDRVRGQPEPPGNHRRDAIHAEGAGLERCRDGPCHLRQAGNREEVIETAQDAECWGGSEQRDARQRVGKPAGVGQADHVGGVVGVLVGDDNGIEPREPSAAGEADGGAGAAVDEHGYAVVAQQVARAAAPGTGKDLDLHGAAQPLPSSGRPSGRPLPPVASSMTWK